MAENTVQTNPKVKTEMGDDDDYFYVDEHDIVSYAKLECPSAVKINCNVSSGSSEKNACSTNLQEEVKCKCEYCGGRFDIEVIELHLESHSHEEQNDQSASLQASIKDNQLDVEKRFQCSCLHTWCAEEGTCKHFVKNPDFSMNSDSIKTTNDFGINKQTLGSVDLGNEKCKENDTMKIGTDLGLPSENKNTDKEQTLHECEYCGKKFNGLNSKTRHLRMHTGETPYECEHCGKKFRYTGDLNRHIKIHTGVKLYRCEHCAKRFYESSALKIHLRIHTGEKPYGCDFCAKRFAESSTLKKHVRIHTGEKPYECEHCGKKFTEKSKVKIHLRIHTGEKPYECELCRKRFSQRRSLKSHFRLHTGDMHRCDYCEKSYTEISTLKNHIRSHAGDTIHQVNE